MRLIFASALIITLSLTGCGPKQTPAVPPAEPRTPTPDTLHIAAAADTARAFAEIGAAFEKSGGPKVAFTFGASGQLTQQIEQGAPFDVFAAANEAYIDKLAKAGKILPDSRHLYAIGQLVLWTRKTMQPPPSKLEDLTAARFAHIALANPQHAPYGKAAQDALTKAKLWDALQAKIVYGENVQQAFQFAQSGNADAALTSHALTIGTEGNTYPVPQELYPPLRQAAAVLQQSKQPEAARQFTAFLTSETGRNILLKYGFVLP